MCCTIFSAFYRKLYRACNLKPGTSDKAILWLLIVKHKCIIYNFFAVYRVEMLDFMLS